MKHDTSGWQEAKNECWIRHNPARNAAHAATWKSADQYIIDRVASDRA